MKKLYILVSITLIIIFSGCNQQFNTEELFNSDINTSENLITVTAVMPNRGSNSDSNGTKPTNISRISMEKKGSDINYLWESGDKLDVILEEADGSRILKSQTVSVFNIREEGRKADFTFDLSGINGKTFNIYIVYGGGGVKENTKVLIPSASKSVGATLKELQDNKAFMLKFVKKDLIKDAPDLTVINFSHVGTLFSIELFNESKETLHDVKKVSFRSSDNSLIGAYVNSSGSAIYDLATDQVELADINNNLMFEIPVAKDLAPGESLIFFGWYIPNDEAWPEFEISVYTSSESLPIKTTINKKVARKFPTEVGAVFYFRAFLEIDKFLLSDRSPAFPPNHVFPRIAEFNIGVTPKTFTDSQDNDKSGYYNYEEALTACPEGWSLPTVEQLNTFLLPFTNPYVNYVIFSGDQTVDYRIINETAYRYEKINNFEYDGNLNAGLKITGRYLGKNGNATIKDISFENWWNTDTQSDIVRYFPAAGKSNTTTGEIEHRGGRIHIWSSTSLTSTTAIIFHAISINTYTGATLKSIKGSVRCIKDL